MHLTSKMQRILLSTIIRNASANQPSGSLYTFDLSSGRVIQKTTIVEPPFRVHDYNLRGGIRGLRGIAMMGEEIFLANASEIFRYDTQWRLLGRISHPSCGSIHDIVCQNNTIWVTSSRNDLLIQFDLAGNILNFHDIRKHHQLFSNSRWNPSPFLSQSKIFQGTIDFRDPASHDHHASDSAHLNGVDILPNGNLLLSLGMMLNSRIGRWLKLKNWLYQHALWTPILGINKWLSRLIKKQSHTVNELLIHPVSAEAAVVEIDHQGNFFPRLHFQGITVPGHSVRILQDGTAIFLNTGNGEVIHFHPQQSKPISRTPVGQHFLRGVRQLADGSLLLGDHQKLIHFDVYQQKVIAQFTICDHPNEAIYDGYLLPENFELPPLSFLPDTLSA